MAQLNFDASQVAPNTGTPDPVPAGWYNVQIDESEMKPTKDGTGTYLQLRFTIIDGQYANRKIYARLNLRNSNPVAQEIAYGELSAICHATGVMQLQDSQQLHGIPLKVKVKLRPADKGYDASNDIANYKNINEQVEDAPAAGGAPVGGGAPAWAGQQGGGAPANAQQPAQQPWQQQPAQQPQQQPAQQQPQNQQPAQQPWQQQPQQQAAQQPAQEQPAQEQPAQQPQQQGAQQPWQQPAQQQPAQQQPQTTAQPPQDQGNGMPPWAQGQ